MAFDKKKFIIRFAGEAKDHITTLNDSFLKLEQTPDDTELLNLAFRCAHTIKGSSRVLSLSHITQVAHKLEDALDALRSNRITVSKDLFNLLFKSIDILGALIEQVQTDEPITIDSQKLCEELEQAASGTLTTPDHSTSQATHPSSTSTRAKKKFNDNETPQPHAEKLPESEIPAKSSSAQPKLDETVRITTAKIDETIKLMGEIISNNCRMKLNLSDLESLKSISNKFLELGQRINDHEELLEHPLIEAMVNLTSELNAGVRQLEENTKDTLNIQSLLAEELRDRVLKMRMFPLSTVTDTFPRMVRDMCSSSGKDVSFTIEGAETELDKKVIEEIGGPLLHIVRNCFDHGIESAEERVKKGKPEKGNIKLSALYEGGNVLIEVSDDGGGIPIERIKERALQKNLHDRESLDAMPKKEIINLIFRPGFSTSAIITDLSGRGVGMDVVKENIIENLKGSIDIRTEEDQGTAFLIRIPVTLAIVRALFVVASELKTAIAVNAISEIIKVSRNEIIEVVNKRAIRLREQIIPVFNLETALHIENPKQNRNMEVYILILSLGSEKLGLVIDGLINEEDIVMVPLPRHMSKIDLVAGVTLVGKDEIVALLHVPRLFSLSKHLQEVKPSEKPTEMENKKQHILVVDDSVSTGEIEKSILETYGYTVDLAADGLEGFEKARNAHYDLVITDVEMPRMDGFTLTENLRKLNEYKHTPIIIVTSLDKESDKRRGIMVGANAYIVKGSFDQSNLLDTVQSLI